MHMTLISHKPFMVTLEVVEFGSSYEAQNRWKISLTLGLNLKLKISWEIHIILRSAFWSYREILNTIIFKIMTIMIILHLHIKCVKYLFFKIIS